jgi:hypothetical protein
MALQFVPYFITVVSRKAKEIMEAEGFTGCEFLACLRSDRKYADDASLIDSSLALLADEAEHFQVLWRAKAVLDTGPIHITDICPECSCVKAYFSDMIDGRSAKFADGAVPEQDFVGIGEIVTPDGVRYAMRGEGNAISARALEILLHRGLRGVNSEYSKNPRADFSIYL